ncbi:MAG: hypothetical protein ACKPKO_10510, partial [Candidatus Fonsibacter sp.]
TRIASNGYDLLRVATRKRKKKLSPWAYELPFNIRYISCVFQSLLEKSCAESLDKTNNSRTSRSYE